VQKRSGMNRKGGPEVRVGTQESEETGREKGLKEGIPESARRGRFRWQLWRDKKGIKIKEGREGKRCKTGSIHVRGLGKMHGKDRRRNWALNKTVER